MRMKQLRFIRGRDFPTSHCIANSLPSPFLPLPHTPAPATFRCNLTEKGPSIISCRGDSLIGDIHKNTANIAVCMCVCACEREEDFAHENTRCSRKCTQAGVCVLAKLNAACTLKHPLQTLSLLNTRANTHTHRHTHCPEPDERFHHDRSTEGPLCLTIE